MPKKFLLFVLLVFPLACGCEWPALAASQPTILSDEDEIRIGKLLADDFIQQEGMASTPQTTKIEAYLQKVGDRVAAGATRKIPYTFRFDPSPSFRSAVGLPGGQVFVGGGILAMMDTEDQLAIVLGHEIEHIDLNQCRDRLAKVLTDEKVAPGAVRNLKVDPFLPGYGHDNEFAADREGVKLAIRAGYSPEGGIRLLQMYVIMGEKATHTPSEARANLGARIEQIREVMKSANIAKYPDETALNLP